MLSVKPERMKVETVDIAGVKISNVSFDGAIELLNEAILSGRKIRVCVTPVNCVVWAQKDPSLKELYNSADLTFCDGVPLLWISRFLGTPIKERITGLDLLPRYSEECSKQGFSIFLLGAKEGVAWHLKETFTTAYPGIKIVGDYSPPFAEKFSNEENNKIINLINNLKPNIVWVSLTAPKQDFWIAENLDKLDVNIAIGVGGAFEVSAGLISRSPTWMQKSGLEWLYRFLNEPRRLFRRYFVEAPAIFPYIIAQKLKRIRNNS